MTSAASSIARRLAPALAVVGAALVLGASPARAVTPETWSPADVSALAPVGRSYSGSPNGTAATVSIGFAGADRPTYGGTSGTVSVQATLTAWTGSAVQAKVTWYSVCDGVQQLTPSVTSIVSNYAAPSETVSTTSWAWTCSTGTLTGVNVRDYDTAGTGTLLASYAPAGAPGSGGGGGGGTTPDCGLLDLGGCLSAAFVPSEASMTEWNDLGEGVKASFPFNWVAAGLTAIDYSTSCHDAIGGCAEASLGWTIPLPMGGTVTVLGPGSMELPAALRPVVEGLVWLGFLVPLFMGVYRRLFPVVGES